MSNDLDTSLDAAVAALRHYVAVARGVREEFDPEQADLDPRVEQASIALGLSLGRLEDEFTAEIGFSPAIEPMWDADEAEADDPGAEAPEDGAELLSADAFSMGLVVGVDATSSPEQLDGVLGVLDDAAATVVDRLEAEGFVVPQYFVARGDHTGFDSDFDDGADDDVDDESEQP